MQIKEVQTDKNLIVEEINFDSNEIAQFENEAGKYLNSKGYKIDGFRPGKVPTAVYKKFFGEDFYNYYVANIAAEKAIKSINERYENLLIDPVITDVNITPEDGSITIEIHKEPEVKYDLSKITIEKRNEDEVIKNYIDYRTKYLLETNAIVEPKEGPAEYNDLVIVKQTVEHDGKVIMDNQEREYVLYEDDDREIIKNLLGKKAGDNVEVEVEYSKDENEKAKYIYKLAVESISERIIPELTDDFVKELGIEEIQTVDALKERFNKEGRDIFRKESLDYYRQRIIDQVDDSVEIEISEKTIERAVDNIIERLKEEGKYEQYFKEHENEEKFKEELKKSYVLLLKKDLLMKDIIVNNGLNVTDEDIREYAETMAPVWGISVDRALSLIKTKQEIRNDVFQEIIERKAAGVIVEKTNIVEVPLEGDNNGEKGDN